MTGILLSSNDTTTASPNRQKPRSILPQAPCLMKDQGTFEQSPHADVVAAISTDAKTKTCTALLEECRSGKANASTGYHI
jgi:hypothetical protein